MHSDYSSDADSSENSAYNHQEVGYIALYVVDDILLGLNIDLRQIAGNYRAFCIKKIERRRTLQRYVG